MSKVEDDLPRRGQMLVPTDPADDPGIYVRYPNWRPDDFAILHSALSDEMIEQALAEGRAKGDGKNLHRGAYLTSLIRQMVQTAHITGRDGKPIPWTPATVKSLPSPVKQWLENEIGRCDGTLADTVQIEIGGVLCDFRQST